MVKVTVLGASGGVGQPLSLLLKMSPYISELALYDIRLAEGVAKDLSHINTNSRCVGYGKEHVAEAVAGARVVLIPAGVPRKPGLTRDDLFKMNAGIVRGLVQAVGTHAPGATLLVISNPVNSMVPVAVETLKQMGVFQAGQVMGVTTLDLVRAQTFLVEALDEQRRAKQSRGRAGEAEAPGTNLHDKRAMRKNVEVLGGHSGPTIVPVLRRASMRHALGPDAYRRFVRRVQYGGDEVVEAKAGAGSATLSMALAGYLFALDVLKSIHGEHQPDGAATSAAYVCARALPGGREALAKLAAPDLDYFALPVQLENGRVCAVDSSVLDSLTPDERAYMATAIAELRKNIDKGRSFATQRASRL